jgi:hypothetical protein
LSFRVEDRWGELHTTRSPQFLGLRNQHGLWSDSDYGSDVIVGVFDTRIWPKRCSFSDKNLGSVPKRWKGTCESGEKFSVINCNRKLIGARFFIKGHEASGASSGVLPITLMNDTVEYRSPRDTNGHGLIRMLRFQHAFHMHAGRNPDASIPTSLLPSTPQSSTVMAPNVREEEKKQRVRKEEGERNEKKK